MSRCDAIRRAIDDFEAIYGQGAAEGEIAIFIASSIALFVNVAGLAAVWGAWS